MGIVESVRAVMSARKRQQAATLEVMNPGRAFLAVGSGEAMNEVPAGLDWPPPGVQLARAGEAS